MKSHNQIESTSSSRLHIVQLICDYGIVRNKYILIHRCITIWGILWGLEREQRCRHLLRSFKALKKTNTKKHQNLT